jgi:hypothetical protein
MSLFLSFFLCLVAVVHATNNSSCLLYDTALSRQRAYICDSLVQTNTWWCGKDWQNATKASKDWPSQVVYLQDLINNLQTIPTNCKTTKYYKDTIQWLNYSLMDPTISGNFGYTWDVFQVQYYDTPRLPNTRIESPDTLGRKCWAFAYLKDMYKPASIIRNIPYNLNNFTSIYEKSINLTFTLCNKVLSNCFVNDTYNPIRNNTCKGKSFEFHWLGFERENIKRKNILKYPWW